MPLPVVITARGTGSRSTRDCAVLSRLGVCALATLACVEQADAGDGSLAGSTAMIEPDCARMGEFTVELGEGSERFDPLASDAQPTLHSGAQGGTHLLLAARVTTPDPLDRYEVSLLAEAGQDCSAGECTSFITIGAIDRVIEGSDWLSVGELEVEIPSLFLVVDGWASAPLRRHTLEVADACDRRASSQRSFDP